MKKVIPVGRKLLIRTLPVNEFYPGTNIIIPESQRKKETKGHVIGVGESVAQIKEGDFIQFSENASLVPMQHEDQEHFLINEGDVFAILLDV